MTHTMPIEKGFVDDRGKILPIEHELANVQMIWSYRGAIRANHYHNTDTHACYLVSGELEYYWRNHGENTIYKEKIVAGQKFVTGPNIDHEMIFTEDSLMVVISEFKRDAVSYDKDIVRISPLHLSYEQV